MQDLDNTLCERYFDAVHIEEVYKNIKLVFQKSNINGSLVSLEEFKSLTWETIVGGFTVDEIKSHLEQIDLQNKVLEYNESAVMKRWMNTLGDIEQYIVKDETMEA